ncbi:peptidoglycan DD-metalloendopeptidase family protein [Alkalicoccus chagannorensis]|uniref:peptidoglycan DD-metalloendopeptidase family protein n=1 Tax=Alkalicoccus chagannorensis TaxID=427072 RepID=UPI000687AD5D|nr:peptidoglycan DD-metalloendopeptidase family protein [Alkalicoccus chagannorensis]
MSDRIQGLTIGLSVDAMQAERGLTGLKDQLRTVNTQMRANMSEFDRADQSLGKYETRLDGLNEKLEVQEAVTEAAGERYEEMVEKHGEGSRQAERAAQEYNKQTAELNNLTRYVEDATVELENMRREQEIAESAWTQSGEAISEAGDRIGEAGEKVQTVGAIWTGVVAGMGAAAAGAAGGLFALTGRVTENADEIAKSSIRMGVSTDFYQDMEFWASQNGIAHGQMEQALQRVNQRMGEARAGNENYQEALEELGISMEDVENGTVDTEEAFAKSIQSLSEMTNEQDQARLAGELFGSTLGRQLLPALQDGSLSMEEAADMMDELGLRMDEQDFEQAQEFQDSMDVIRRSLGQVTQQIGLELMPHFQQMLDWILNNMPDIQETMSNAFDQVEEKIRTVVKWWRELSGSAQAYIGIAAGVTAVMGPLLLVLGTLMRVIGPVITQLGQMFMWVGRVGGIFNVLRIALVAVTGPVGLIVAAVAGLTAAFIMAYQNSETFRERLSGAIEGAQDVFQSVVEVIKNLVDDVVADFREFIGTLREFWDENGEMIQEAAENIWTGISWMLERIWDYVEKIMPAIEMTFQTVWGAISTIIQVATNTIMGIIEIFAGLFTGDIDAMLEGVKRIFFGGFEIVREFLSDFVSNALSMAGGLRENFSDQIDRLRNLVTGFIGRMRDGSVERLTSMRNRFSSINTRIRDNMREAMQRMYDNTIGRVLDMRREAVRRFNVMKDSFFDVGRDIRDNISERFDDMVSAARDLPGRIGDGISNMASRATSGVKSFANSIGSTLEDGVNNVVGGMNSLLSTIGVSLRVPTISVPQYATGTEDHPGGPAVVGEKGRELAHIPGQGYTILGQEGAELLNLPKGSSVLPNRKTERLLTEGMGLPGYESGIGRAFSWVKDTAQSGWENMTDLASNAVGWLLEAPSKLFEKVMEFTGVDMPEADDFAGGVMRGSFDAFRSAVEEKLQGAQSEVGPGSPSFSGFRMTSPFGMRTHPITGDRRMHNGVDYAAPTGTPIPAQGGGIVSFAGNRGTGFGNYVTVRSGVYDHIYAHNSRNLVRAGQSVSRGDVVGLVGSTGASTGPHVHYEVRRDGTPVNPKGFATGGLIQDEMITRLGEGGHAEYVIPTDPSRASEAQKLLALAGKDIEKNGRSKRPHQLPNAGGGSVLEELQAQTQELRQQRDVLMAILQKETGIEIDGREVARAIDPHSQKYRDSKEIRRLRKEGLEA